MSEIIDTHTLPVSWAEKPRRRGPRTRFPNKVRAPFALGLPPNLHVTLQQTADRLSIKRGDVVCELLTQYADKLRIEE